MLYIIIKCFEGLKAYRDGDGKIRLFRPMMNMNRLNVSAVASSLPVSVSKEQVIGNVKWHTHNCVCDMSIKFHHTVGRNGMLL